MKQRGSKIKCQFHKLQPIKLFWHSACLQSSTESVLFAEPSFFDFDFILQSSNDRLKKAINRRNRTKKRSCPTECHLSDQSHNRKPCIKIDPSYNECGVFILTLMSSFDSQSLLFVNPHCNVSYKVHEAFGIWNLKLRPPPSRKKKLHFFRPDSFSSLFLFLSSHVPSPSSSPHIS